MRIEFIGSEQNVADALTKALPPTPFLVHRDSFWEEQELAEGGCWNFTPASSSALLLPFFLVQTQTLLCAFMHNIGSPHVSLAPEHLDSLHVSLVCVSVSLLDYSVVAR